MPSVTAIVPTCNRHALLKRALRSIAAQELFPFEVIVIDDGDEANRFLTHAAAEQSGLKNILVVANSHAKGASGARNTGAELATGELVAFLDDDDEWLPSYLSQAVGHCNWSELDVICTPLLCQFEDGIDRLAKSAPDYLATELFLTRNPGLGGLNLIIRRSLYRDIGGFDESLPSCDDLDLGIIEPARSCQVPEPPATARALPSAHGTKTEYSCQRVDAGRHLPLLRTSRTSHDCGATSTVP